MRSVFDEGERSAPRKTELSERIEATGSLAAAEREMGMSHKRACMLVETLNAMFRAAVLHSGKGGPGGGGAVLTDAGRAALTGYRRAKAASAKATEPHFQTLKSMVGDILRKK